MVVTPGDPWGFFLQKVKAGNSLSEMWIDHGYFESWSLHSCCCFCCRFAADVRSSGEPLLLEIKKCWSYLKFLSALVSHLWVRIWGHATSLKYEDQLWCANEDVFAVVASYQAFVLLLPSLLCLMLLLRLLYCPSAMHMGWHAEREKQQSPKIQWVNIHYQLNPFPFNNGREKNNSPYLLQLHSSNILIPKAVFLSFLSLFVARAVLPVEGRSMWASADEAEGGCWVPCWSWVDKHANNSSVLSKLHFCVWIKVIIQKFMFAFWMLKHTWQ